MKKILLIDDEKDFCSTIKDALESASSFEVETCSNAMDAFEKAKEIKPDLILLDVMMPELSGPEIAAQLKNCEETKNIPVVFLTAVLDEREAEAHKNVIGGEYFLGKPVKLKELLYLVSTLIG